MLIIKQETWIIIIIIVIIRKIRITTVACTSASPAAGCKGRNRSRRPSVAKPAWIRGCETCTTACTTACIAACIAACTTACVAVCTCCLHLLPSLRRAALRRPHAPVFRGPVSWAALLVERSLSNTASFVFYGITCLKRLIESAALFATFEEEVCQTSGVRQVAPAE